MNRLLSVLIIIFIILSGLLPVNVRAAELSKAEKESRLGHLFDLYMTESFVMLRDDSLHEKIQEIVNRIITATERSDNNIRLRIINEHLPIVSSFPGYVYVSSGMLDILESESELAFVIFHAISHTMTNDQFKLYINALKQDQMARLTGQMMPLMVFSGVAGVAVAGAAASLEGIALTGSGIYSTSTVANILIASDTNKARNNQNLFVPYLGLSDTKQSLSAMVFLSDVYTGYGEKAEIQADNMAINYIAKAGYDTSAIVPLLEKLKESRNDHIARGDIIHLLLADPGLEKRIDNARHVLENN